MHGPQEGHRDQNRPGILHQIRKASHIVWCLFCFALQQENTQKFLSHCRSLRETGFFVREWQTTEGGTCAIIK